MRMPLFDDSKRPHKVHLRKVQIIEASGRNFLYHEQANTYHEASTLREAEKLYHGAGFVMISREHLINMHEIEHYEETTSMITLVGGKQIKVREKSELHFKKKYSEFLRKKSISKVTNLDKLGP